MIQGTCDEQMRRLSGGGDGEEDGVCVVEVEQLSLMSASSEHHQQPTLRLSQSIHSPASCRVLSVSHLSSELQKPTKSFMSFLLLMTF